NITMYYTDTLAWYNLSISGTLDYDQFIYEIIGYNGSSDVQDIKGIQQIKIGDYWIEEFEIILEGTSILLKIDEKYRYLLSSQNTDKIKAQLYESFESNNIVLQYNNSINKWELKSPSLNYFNISQYLNLTEGNEFLLWFKAEDSIGNVLYSHNIKGIYDNSIAQIPVGKNVFEWALGTNSTGSGIIIFGSDQYLDSTIQVNISSVLSTSMGEVDVERIMISGSPNTTKWDYVGRAYYSGEEHIWNYYWDWDLLDTIPPENYNLRILLFDRAGNFLNHTHSVKLFDYTQIELITDLVFGHIFEYNSSLFSNENLIEGEIKNYFGSLDLWEVISQYYNPLEKVWVPMATDSATILSNGSYSITWDIDKDSAFKASMYDFSYGYLPMQAVAIQNSDLWGSWAMFDSSGEWKPIIISDTGSNLDISVYRFNEGLGWELDSSLSIESTISSINNQVFKLWDLNKDNIYEIIRISSAQIDVIYLDANSDWVIKKNVTGLSGYTYITFDIEYDGNTANTVFIAVQEDIAGEISLWKYSFDTDYGLTYIRHEIAPTNFIPTSIKIVNFFSASDRKAVLVGGLIKNSYYSQLFEYSINLELKNILHDELLGEILVIEYDEINGADSIILGIERLAIGKMDAVISLRRKTGTEAWIEFEITGFDDTRFEILDLLTISDNNLKKLIIASKTGLFSTEITFSEDTTTVTSPVVFTTDFYSKQDLSPIYYPVIEHFEERPINTVYEVFYKLTGSSQWQKLDISRYKYARFAIQLDLLSIWTSLSTNGDCIKIAYGYESFMSKERVAIDPSFQSYSGQSDTQGISASALFFDDSALPMMWLNPGTRYSDLNAHWNSLPNSMTYQYTPVISGYGSKVYYPTVTSGWDNGYGWGPEYTTMPELENSLIYYDGSYDSGELAQNLNSKDEYAPESKFGGNFENNYIDNVLISNPYVSDTYNFSQMYYPEIHDEQQEGLYNYYDPNDGSNNAQYAFVRNQLTDVATNNTTTINVYDSGTIPESISEELLQSISFSGGGAMPPGGSYSPAGVSNTYINDSNYLTIRYGGSAIPMPAWYISITSFNLASTLNNDDIYLSFTLQMQAGGEGYLKINGAQYGSTRSSFTLDRVPIQGVNSIGFSSSGTYDAYLYYFKVERITSDNAFMQNPSVSEVENVMLDWSQYLTTSKDSYGVFGLEYTYKLPVVSRDSLDSIQLSFDASINSLSFEGGNYPLSIQLWNYEFQQWESIPLASLLPQEPFTTDYYDGSELDYDFWTGLSSLPGGWTMGPTDAFRPDWSSLGFQRINTVGYGATFPYSVDINGNIVFDDSLIAGGSFLVNDDTDHQLYSLYDDQGKVLFYDDQYNFLIDEINTNKWQLQNIIIDPSNFYSTDETFPAYTTAEPFYSMSEDKFYEYFINDLNEFKIQIITKREPGQSAVDDATLCIGSFNTYTLTTTNYMNYNDFESNAINGEHVSDKIVFTSDGVKLFGDSGFNIKDTPQTVKFKDNFLSSSWTLEDVLEPTMDIQKSLASDTYVRSYHPGENYNGFYPLSAWQRDFLFDPDKAWNSYINFGTWDSGDVYDTWTDNGVAYQVDSQSYLVIFQRTQVGYDAIAAYKTENVFYDISVDIPSNIYIYYGDANGPIGEAIAYVLNSLSLSGNVIKDRNPDHSKVWISTFSNIPHTVSVDWLVSQGVIDEYETFIETSPLSYLIQGANDAWELEADLVQDWGWDAQLFSVGSFNPGSITWNNKDSIPVYSLISNDKTVGDKVSWDLGDLTTENKYFKIDTPTWGGVDFASPIIKYSIAKKHQEGGLLYMQTNEASGEQLTLKSQVYNSNITITPNDQLVIEFQGATGNKVDLTLFSGGQIQKVYNIVPDGNTDFSSQFILLETEQTLQFDQLNFTGILDDTEYFSVNSITVMEGASLIDTKLAEYPFIIQSGGEPMPDVDFASEDSSSLFAHYKDNLFYNISSGYISDEDYRMEVKFDFDMTDVQMEDVDKVQIWLIAQSTGTLLEDADYSILGTGYDSINFEREGDVLMFTISKEDVQKYLTEESKIAFKIYIIETNPFDIFIDKLSIVTFKEWSVEHDFYRAAFRFEKLGSSQFGDITVGINGNISLTINNDDPSLNDAGQENLVSFNYDFTTQKWSAFINDNFTDKLNLTDTNPVMKPRIESRYDNLNQGIIVYSIESHYYKKIENQADFEKYKSLILSYQDKLDHSATLQTNVADSILTPENVLTQLSADIDIIYSFNDEMVPENIFSYNLQPTFTSDYFDNIGTYQYNESAFMVGSVSPIVNNTVSSVSGDSVITSGILSDLNDIYSNNAEFESDWTTERYDSVSLTVNVGSVSHQTDPDWDIYDDSAQRDYTGSSSAPFITVKDEYSFINLPSWVADAADTEIELLIHWNYGAGAASGSCKIYAMNWGAPGDSDDEYEYLGISISRNQWTAESITLTSSHLKRNSTTYETKIKIETETTDSGYPWSSSVTTTIEYLYLDFKKTDASASVVNFNFENILDGKSDLFVYFRGKTDGFTSKLLIDDVNEQSFSGTFTQFEDFFYNVDSIRAWIADDGEVFHPSLDNRKLILDNLEIMWLSQLIDYTLANKPVGINASASHRRSSSSYSDTGMFDDPFFGKNSVQFTLKNTLYTPAFGRPNASAYVDLELSDLDLDFEVFRDIYPSFVLEDEFLEGKDEAKYPPAVLQNYTKYSNSRFKNSPLDDIQIPLVTPISLDFGQLTMDELSQGNLELALNLDIDLNNRMDDSKWSSRFRLLYYNYTSQQWQDFNGLLRASNEGEPRSVWNPSLSDNFVWYLQNVGANEYIPISNENDISIANPITISSLDNTTIQDGKIKLALISYIIPSNFSIDPTHNYFIYERANPLVPINISQTVDVSESVLIVESQEIMYPEATLTANLPLDEDFRLNLSTLNNLGEIVAVKGRFINEESIPFEYPIYYYWV
ncbi:hypothetical protein LCGC14_0946350, partial [marine sediment metagenome]